MLRICLCLLIAVSLVGCGGSKSPKADTTTSQATEGKPDTEAAKTKITEFLAQCGWKDIEITSLEDQVSKPELQKNVGESWCYLFSAKCVNLLNESIAIEKWTAVVIRDVGQIKVRSCFDDKNQQVGGHYGTEFEKEAVLIPASYSSSQSVPAIIPPKP